MSSEQLPAGWIRKESGSRPGTFYYFNTDTGESQWDKPTAARGDEVRCLHLLQKHRGSRRPASWRNDNITCTKEAAIGVLRGLREQIERAGTAGGAAALRAEFERLAQQHSDCSSAKRGGDLGHFGRGAMQKAFEDAAFGLQVGQLSGIVDTDSGVHIILRVE